MRLHNVALMGLVVWGCGEGGESVPEVVRVDSAGVEWVTTVGDDAPLDIEFRRVATLGGEGEVQDLFQLTAAGLAVGPGGEIVVLDPGNNRVVIFDESGDFIRTWGREGQGPGEFQIPTALTVGPDGVVEIYDLGRGRNIRFDMYGELQEDTEGMPGFIGGRVRMYGDARVFRVRDTSGGVWSLRRIEDGVDGEPELILESDLAPHESVTYRSCGIRLSLPPLFSQMPAWDAAGNMIAIVKQDEYRADIHSLDGMRRSVARDIEPREATMEDAEVYLGEGRRWTIGAGEECVVPPDEVISERGIADHLPMVDDVAWRPGGELWVQRFKPDVENGPIDVFRPDGEYRGTLPTGTPWPDLFRSEDQVLVIEEDDVGYETVALYEMTVGS